MYSRYGCDNNLQRLVINLLVPNYRAFQITVIYVILFPIFLKSVQKPMLFISITEKTRVFYFLPARPRCEPMVVAFEGSMSLHLQEFISITISFLNTFIT